MQIPKLFPVVCAAAFGASCLAVQAQDNPAQAAAREALEQKISEPGTQPAQPAQPAPPPVTVTPSGAEPAQPNQLTNKVVVRPARTPARRATPAPAAKSAPATQTFQPVPTTADTGPQERAKAALEQKLNELDQQSMTAPAATPAIAPATYPATAPAAAPAATPAATPATVTAPPPTPAATSPVKPAPPAVKTQVTSPPGPSNPGYPGRELGLKPITAPGLPISPAKEAQLQGLLERYKADQITPEQYHTERARILAEP